MVAWTSDLLHRVLDHEVADTGRRPAAFRKQVCDQLVADAAEVEARLGKREAEERALADELLVARAAATLAGLYDDAVVGRVAKAEVHLARELQRALATLDQYRALREHRVRGGEREVRPLRVVGGEGGPTPRAIGFVLENGPPESG